MKRIYFIFLLLGLAACNGGKNQTNIELMDDMMDQKSLKSQDWDDDRHQQGNRTPPEGTVARGKPPYKYAGDPFGAEKNLTNPEAANKNPQFIARGKERYEVYCSPCHGMTGKGDGKVAEFLALKPPSLVVEKAKAFRDGRLFHIITDGQGLMNNYATQIHKPEDRWAIVNYVRVLQRGN